MPPSTPVYTSPLPSLPLPPPFTCLLHSLSRPPPLTSYLPWRFFVTCPYLICDSFISSTFLFTLNCYIRSFLQFSFILLLLLRFSSFFLPCLLFSYIFFFISRFRFEFSSTVVITFFFFFNSSSNFLSRFSSFLYYYYFYYFLSLLFSQFSFLLTSTISQSRVPPIPLYFILFFTSFPFPATSVLILSFLLLHFFFYFSSVVTLPIISYSHSSFLQFPSTTLKSRTPVSSFLQLSFLYFHSSFSSIIFLYLNT